jgi:subtilisin-like proprotein convertase family protein
MRRSLPWLILSLLCFGLAVYFWRLGDRWAAEKKAPVPPVSSSNSALRTPHSALPPTPDTRHAASFSSAKALARLTNNSPLPFRLSNTTNRMAALEGNDHAILLENALLDTDQKVDLAIPPHLKSHGNPGAYIVQARRPIDDAFRALLQSAGATIISYIPNNAYLVRFSGGSSFNLQSPLVQAVLPYEPYYKLKPALLAPAIGQQALPEGTVFNVLVYTDALTETENDLKALGAEVVGSPERSPFGRVLHVAPPLDATPAIAQLPGVQEMELARPRLTANDLSRVTLGISGDSVTTTNYPDTNGLSGTNITVGVVDTGVDTNHPDLLGRVLYDLPISGVDSNGHGTFVAGIISGSGFESTTVSNAQGSIMPGTNGQFRGKAPAATNYSISFLANSSDTYLQEQLAAQTNVLIANNSWTYGSESYDLASANYDAAVRDAIPETSGSRQLLYVFPSGNGGTANVWDNGVNGDGSGGSPDSIQSPGTAKNVITVGALEQLRNITNETAEVIGVDTNGQPFFQTNQPWLASSDSSDQVAGFSGRGNVGIGIEGDAGRFKPDVVAPGTAVVSTRSTQWDEAAYYNPTNFTEQFRPGIVVDTNSLFIDLLFVPLNAVGVSITISPNADSPSPFPIVPIYLKAGAIPGTNTGSYDFFTTNGQAVMPDDHPLSPVGTFWYYAIANNSSTQPLSIDLDVITTVTNQHGNFLTVLSNLNDSLGGPPFYYRYESGTSLAAAEASGVLALMEEFLESRSGLFSPSNRPSPALMKALLINGARSAASFYDFQVQSSINFQGWGLINVSNSVPPTLANFKTNGSSSLLLFDQDPTNALFTGQTHTRLVTLNADAQNAPMRITLAWTDPPGNPVAGKKLVNDLDLIVTNLDTGEVFYGNDILSGNEFTLPSDTNLAPNIDVVNNVENVYLQNALGTNYSVTVLGHRVNVNAVTAHTNQVVQDYALVISSDASYTNGLSVTNSVTLTNGTIITTDVSPASPPTIPLLTTITNQFTGDTNFTGGILLNQRAGASTPILGLNTVSATNLDDPSMGLTAGLATIGMTNQWHFYVITNDNGFTNASFLTFLPPTLSIPRIGTRASSNENATRLETDVDMYVSTDPNLTNLDRVALNGAYKSLTREGSETVVLTNALPTAYYIGVKSESQEAAEYGFMGVFSLLPPDNVDDQGNHHLHGFPVPQAIPDGTPLHPGGIFIFAIATSPVKVHRVVVTNNISHQLMGDLQGTLRHSRVPVVLNNHSPEGAETNRTFIYDDSGQHDVVVPAGLQNAVVLHSDGPGDLMQFAGQAGVGQWLFTMVDNASGHVGTNNDFGMFIERQQNPTDGISNSIPPNSCVVDYLDVAAGYTNMTVCVTNTTQPSGGGPVVVTICAPDGGACLVTNLPTTLNGGIAVNIDLTTVPLITPGTWTIKQCNLSLSQTVSTFLIVKFGPLSPIVPTQYQSSGPVALADDAVTTSSMVVTNDNKIFSVEVGLRVDHPRVSDLVFHLISPSGVRSLICENRGGLTTNGMGLSIITTNIATTSFIGGPDPQTNNIDTAITNWTATIDYDFFHFPDWMTVYSGSNIVYDSGTFISGSGTLQLSNTFGGSTVMTIVMNRFPPPNTNTAWTYTVGSTHAQYLYYNFTEDTNKTITPIKFATPPFIPNTNAVVITPISDFEVPTNVYAVGSTVDGWTVAKNQVSVTSASANTGVNSLALGTGNVSRVIPTIPGNIYTLNFAYRQAPLASMQGLVAWWKAENNPLDATGNGNTGVLSAGTSYGAGEVNQTFTLDGVNSSVIAPASGSMAVQSFTLEGWIFPSNSVYSPIIEYGMNGAGAGPHLWVNGSGLSQSQGVLFGNVRNPDFEAFSAANVVPINQWSHVAMVYDSVANTLVLYWNGTPVANNSGGPANPPSTSLPVNLGLRPPGSFEAMAGTRFSGRLDEMSIFNRALSAAEVQSIVIQGSKGKCGLAVPPAVCLAGSPATAQILINGQPATSVSSTDTNWVTATLSLNAPSTGSSLEVDSLSGGSPGLLFDTFSLTGQGGTNAVLPEESIDKLKGSNAKGQWQMEVWDNRVGPFGATNVAPSLVSWQLSFIFENQIPLPVNLEHGQPITNTVCPGQMQTYSIDVPYWTDFASNRLISATLPVNVWFNQTQPPTGNLGAGDVLLVPNSLGGTFVIDSNSIPTLIPSATYFIGIQRTNDGNPQCAQYVFDVEFDVTPLSLGAPVRVTNSPTAAKFTRSVTATNTGPTPKYFSYVVNSNETAVSFQVTNIQGGNVDLVVSRGPHTPPPPDLTTFDYGSFNPGTEDEQIIITTNSDPVILSTGTWYLGVFNRSTNTVSYTVSVTDFTNAVPNIIPLFLNVPYNNTNASPPGLPDYYSYTVTSNETGVQFQLLNLTGDVNLVAQKGFPPLPSGTSPYSSSNPGTNNESILVFTNSTPVPLTPGDWFLAVLNPSGANVSYTVLVTDTTNVIQSIITLTNTVPYFNTNNAGANFTDFYRFVVSTNGMRAQFEINNPSVDMALAVRKNLPLPTFSTWDYFSNNPGTNDELITVLNSSSPVPLSPGDWFLSAVNISGVPAQYSIKATEFATSGTNIVVSNPHMNVTSNEFCFSFNTLVGVHYYVQARPVLPATNWDTLQTFVATDTNTFFCWLLPSQYHFFRVGEGVATNNFVPQQVQIKSISRGPSGVLLTWNAVFQTQYQVLWTPSLAPPNWTTFSNIITSTNGTCTFLDDGSQSGGLGPLRYYRLRNYP